VTSEGVTARLRRTLHNELRDSLQRKEIAMTIRPSPLTPLALWQALVRSKRPLNRADRDDAPQTVRSREDVSPFTQREGLFFEPDTH
jgi:hypothetical protein